MRASAAHALRAQEMACMDKEDILSQWCRLGAQEQGYSNAVLDEARREIQRYRFEIITSQRLVGQKQREISFLKSQLVLAAERITSMSRGVPSYWDDKNGV